MKIESNFKRIFGHRIHFLSGGSGNPIVFLHGNPTSSYIWRNILPATARHGRVIAPDLIGMGLSDKPNISYSVSEHARYLAAFLDSLDMPKFSLVLHDWGGPLGFSYALDNIERIQSITIMETIVAPLKWNEFSLFNRIGLQAIRLPLAGYILAQALNLLQWWGLPRNIAPGHRLAHSTHLHYTEPHPTIASRYPLRRWIKALPFKPSDDGWNLAYRICESLPTLKIPMLLLRADPGLLITNKNIDRILSALPPTIEISNVGSGYHFMPEATPNQIAQTLGRFIKQNHCSDLP